MKQIIQHLLFRHWDALLASALGCIWIAFYTSKGGIGISPDSVAYLSTADHFADSFRFSDYNNLPLVNFPLGYPFLLGVIKWVSGANLLLLAPCLNAFLLALVLYTVSFLLIETGIQSGIFRLLILVFILSNPGMLEVYSMLWSETVFLVLGLFFVMAFLRYLKSHSISWLLWAALIVSFTCMVRYVGVTWIITGGILILFNTRFNWQLKLKHVLVFGITGAILPLLNTLRNYWVTDTIAGVRQTSLKSFTSNLADFLNVLGYWFPLGNAENQSLLIIFGTLLLLLIITFLGFRFIQQQFYNSPVTIISLFTLVYGGFMLFIASVSRFETLSSRLLIPLYIPIIILIAWFFYTWIIKTRQYKKWLVIALFLSGYTAGAHYHYQTHAFNWEGIGYAGIPGYTDMHWKSSPLLKFMKSHHQQYQAPIYSNTNDAVFFLADIKANPLPHKDIPSEISDFLKTPHIYLVWFVYGKNDDLIDDAFIRKHYRQTSEWQFKDGSIFYFTRNQQK
ncbi:hypothetical protein [Sediminibacterium sp. C3]|uniref:hypothetical protein n=1 Tax=Sediminibacterium sp. C3 TaxID=1267211 RepID=UPI0004176563|nr:hypothetical protein [Sediminibacterium sp. C3]